MPHTPSKYRKEQSSPQTGLIVVEPVPFLCILPKTSYSVNRVIRMPTTLPPILHTSTWTGSKRIIQNMVDAWPKHVNLRLLEIIQKQCIQWAMSKQAKHSSVCARACVCAAVYAEMKLVPGNHIRIEWTLNHKINDYFYRMRFDAPWSMARARLINRDTKRRLSNACFPWEWPGSCAGHVRPCSQVAWYDFYTQPCWPHLRACPVQLPGHKPSEPSIT